MGGSVKTTIDRTLEIEVPLVVCIDSKSLYELPSKARNHTRKATHDRRNVPPLAYERREIAEVKWIKGESNPADSMTKSKPSNTLKRLIDTNTIQLDVKEWVERE